MKSSLLLLGATLLLWSCNNSPKESQDTASQTSQSQQQAVDKEAAPAKFSIDNIPFSTSDLGDFPFFTAPDGAKYINNVKTKAFDFLVFVTPDDIFEVEGKTYRSWVQEDPESKTELSGRYLFKSYDDAITKVGGVKIFEGALDAERLEQYNKLCTYAGDDGSFIPSGDQQIVSYVIRRKEGNIYITLEKKDFPSTSIQIVQEKPFQQTIQKVTSDDIVKDLTEKGKSILYINFDTDRSNVTDEGKETVDQIVGALTKDKSLKIGIEGHTDNTGEAAHNKKLSNDRANAVMKLLIADGIDKSRLTAAGFGAERPLVANDSEENKSKNRRVELIKTN